MFRGSTTKRSELHFRGLWASRGLESIESLGGYSSQVVKRQIVQPQARRRGEGRANSRKRAFSIKRIQSSAIPKARRHDDLQSTTNKWPRHWQIRKRVPCYQSAYANHDAKEGGAIHSQVSDRLCKYEQGGLTDGRRKSDEARVKANLETDPTHHSKVIPRNWTWLEKRLVRPRKSSESDVLKPQHLFCSYHPQRQIAW